MTLRYTFHRFLSLLKLNFAFFSQTLWFDIFDETFLHLYLYCPVYLQHLLESDLNFKSNFFVLF